MESISKRSGLMSLLCALIAVASIVSGTTASGQIVNIVLTGAVLFYLLEISLASNQIRVTIVMVLLICMILIFINKSVTELAPFIILSLYWILERTDYSVLDRANKVYLIVGMVLFSLIVIVAIVTGFHNTSFQIWRGSEIVSRVSIGFTHPNVALVRWYGLVASFCIVFFKRNRVILYISVAIITLFLYTYTKSRTATLLVIGMLAVVVIGESGTNRESRLYIDSRFLIIIPWLMLAISYSFLKISWLQTHFDALLSGRISIYLQYFQRFGVHMFANSDTDVSMIDNSYIQLLITKGLAYTVVLLTGYSIIIGSVKKSSIKTAVIILTFFALGITEATLQHLELILPLLIAISMDKRIELQKDRGIEDAS